MKSFIVVDGGGTKSEVLLVDTLGKIHYRLLTTCSNPNDVTMETSLDTLEKAISKMLSFSNEHSLKIEKIYLLIAGIEFGDSKEILKRNLEKTFGIECVVDGDLASVKEVGLYNENDGIVIISGTGFNMAIKEKGTFKNIGGWGYLADDYLSGFDLGKEALVVSSRDINGVGKPTVLTKLLEEYFSNTLWYSMAEIYRGGVKKVASLSKFVIEAYLKGDEVAQDIIDKRIEYLSMVIKNSTRGMNEKIKVYLFGGVFENNKFICDNLANSLGKDYFVSISHKKTIYGAVYFAMKDLKYKLDDEFIDKFDAEYKSCLMD